MVINSDEIYHCNALVPKQPSNSLKTNYCHSTNIHIFQRPPVKPSQHRAVGDSPGDGKEEWSQGGGEAFEGGGCRSVQHGFIVRGGFECNVDNIAGGGDRPLGENLPDRFKVTASNGKSQFLTNGLELHRLVVEDCDQLERRSKELNKKIIDAKCSDVLINEVSEPTSLPLLPR